MFSYCTKLVGGNGTSYDESHIDAKYARVDAPGTPGYLTLKVQPDDSSQQSGSADQDGDGVADNTNSDATSAHETTDDDNVAPSDKTETTDNANSEGDGVNSDENGNGGNNKNDGNNEAESNGGNGDVGNDNADSVRKSTGAPSGYAYSTVSAGDTIKIGAATYKVTGSKKVVYLKAPKSKKTVTMPATVKVNGKSAAVVGIAKNAFKGSKVKTVTAKSKRLTKQSVKGCFKASKVKTVKVKVGSKKLNAKYVKKYTKTFAKKNSGRKVVVK